MVPADNLARAVLGAIGGAAALAEGWLRGLTPDRLGAFAPLVLEQAAAGVPAARAIRERALDHLAALAGVLDAGAVTLYAAGGVADVLRSDLAARLGRPVLMPEGDAVAGCWRVAAGRAPDEQAQFFATVEALQ